MMEENEEYDSELVTIAGKPKEVYTQVIIDKMQLHDQVKIQVTSKYLERAIIIIKQFEVCGWFPWDSKHNCTNNLKFESEMQDIVTRDGRKTSREMVHKVTLSKLPEYYRFTHN